MMNDFEQLAASRRDWINGTLRTWCRTAPLRELRKAEQEWFDIAGKADVKATLWTWAWERFPDIVHADLPGVNETSEVIVTLTDGTELRGFPEGRQSERGMLVLVGRSESGDRIVYPAVSIDSICGVRLS